MDDVLVDDFAGNSSLQKGRNKGAYFFGQTFSLNPGTYTIRVKGGITGGSGTDYIEFPVNNGTLVLGPAHCVVRKYKTN